MVRFLKAPPIGHVGGSGPENRLLLRPLQWRRLVNNDIVPYYTVKASGLVGGWGGGGITEFVVQASTMRWHPIHQAGFLSENLYPESCVHKFVTSFKCCSY